MTNFARLNFLAHMKNEDKLLVYYIVLFHIPAEIVIEIDSENYNPDFWSVGSQVTFA